MKKTLEEAAVEYALKSKSPNREARRMGFVDGAKYQQSITPFSEEDMIGFAEWSGGLHVTNDRYLLENKHYSLKELLKLYLKNKKK